MRHLARWTRTLDRVPFTLVLLAALITVGVLTGTVVRWIEPVWTERLGFAARDLIPPDTWRVVGSALVTTGGRTFWEAFVAVALLVGWSELLAGTALAAGVFWGTQVVTLAVESGLLWVFRELTGSAAIAAALQERSVGASLGFVGSLGLVLSQLPGRRGLLLSAGALGVLVGLIFLPYPSVSAAVKLSDDLGHLVAFPLGWVAGRLWGRRRRTGAAVSPQA